jgi:esterase/lipase
MRGLGTAPRQLCDVKWEDWVHSFNRGYAVLKNTCEHIFVGGFSSGGILALINAARKQKAVQGLFCINSPIILANIKTRFLPAALAWNDLLDKFHISKGKLEYVVNPTESPDINYSLNYIKGLRQLDQMITECRKVLSQITIPTLVIQSNHDPVVDPKSAEIIYSKIQSTQKQFVSLERSRHVIVRQEGKEEVFEKIHAFIENVAKTLP